MKLPEKAKKVFTWIIYNVYHWEQELFDWSTATFEMLKRNFTIDVLPIWEDGMIYVSNERQPWRPPFLTFVWWCSEDWEVPLETAKRELMEEMWLYSDEFELFTVYNNTWKIDYDQYFYIARNCKQAWTQKLDAWEDIKISKVDWKWFLDTVADPRFRLKEFALDVFRQIYSWKEEEFKNIIYWK